jgi:hypothetical protein
MCGMSQIQLGPPTDTATQEMSWTLSCVQLLLALLLRF